MPSSLLEPPSPRLEKAFWPQFLSSIVYVVAIIFLFGLVTDSFPGELAAYVVMAALLCLAMCAILREGVETPPTWLQARFCAGATLAGCALYLLFSRIDNLYIQLALLWLTVGAFKVAVIVVIRNHSPSEQADA